MGRAGTRGKPGLPGVEPRVNSQLVCEEHGLLRPVSDEAYRCGNVLLSKSQRGPDTGHCANRLISKDGWTGICKVLPEAVEVKYGASVCPECSSNRIRSPRLKVGGPPDTPSASRRQ
jgi:hypothetical protein